LFNGEFYYIKVSWGNSFYRKVCFGYINSFMVEVVAVLDFLNGSYAGQVIPLYILSMPGDNGFCLSATRVNRGVFDD